MSEETKADAKTRRKPGPKSTADIAALDFEQGLLERIRQEQERLHVMKTSGASELDVLRDAFETRRRELESEYREQFVTIETLQSVADKLAETTAPLRPTSNDTIGSDLKASLTVVGAN